MNTVTINAELKDHVNKAGQSKVYIRITQNKKHKRIKVDNVEVKKNEWTGKHGAWVSSKNKNHEKLNITIQEKLTEYKNQYLDLKKASPVITKEHLYNAVIKEQVSKNFIEYWDLKTTIKAMPEYNQRKGYDTTRGKIIAFAGENIDFREITQDWLEEFETHLRSDKEGLGDASIHTQQKRIRAIWNLAVSKDKIIDKNLYPFGKGGYKMPIIPEKAIEKLDTDEVKEILKLKYNKEQQIFYVHKGFIFSFRASGIRIEDLLTLKWNNVKNGRLIYNMKKGVTNGALQNIEITEKMQAVLDEIKAGPLKKGDYILPFLEPGSERLTNEDYKKEVGRKTSLFNKYLKKVANDIGTDKSLTSHVAKHSWAAYAYSETKDIKFVQQNLKHKNAKTTEIYIGKLGVNQNDAKRRTVEI